MNAKHTDLGSSGDGAVSVRPMRLPWPEVSTKRYQYSRAGRNPPTRTRVVQSASARGLKRRVAITRVNFSSSATSRLSGGALFSPPLGGRLVHRITLSPVGSPEATPSGKSERFSIQRRVEAVAEDSAKAQAAPSASAVVKSSRRVVVPAIAFPLESGRLMDLDRNMGKHPEPA